MIDKIYILVFLVVYFIAVFIYPTIRVKRKTGIIAYVFSNTDSLQDYIRKVLTLINFLIFFTVLTNLFPDVYQYLMPGRWLEVPVLKYTGFTLVHVALLRIVNFAAHHLVATTNAIHRMALFVTVQDSLCQPVFPKGFQVGNRVFRSGNDNHIRFFNFFGISRVK